MTFVPGLFYIFITVFFILNSKIGFNIDYTVSKMSAILVTLISIFVIYFTKLKKQ